MPLLWNGFSAITSFFVVDRKFTDLESVNFFYVCLYANFQFSWWSRDHFSAPFRDLYLPNAWVTDSPDKRHTFRVSLFHRYHWFGVKLFPVDCAQDSRRYPKNAKNAVFGLGSADATKFRFFFTMVLVLTSTLTVWNRGDPSSLNRKNVFTI